MDISDKAERRHEKIKELLLKNNIYLIEDFCRDLDVSEATIRNDLTYLEKQGRLRRITSGAVATLGTMYDSVYARRSSLCVGEKKKIAKYVTENYIKDGMTITLDSGSTCRMIAEEIIDRKIKCSVVTNSLSALNVLTKSRDVAVYLAGGRYNQQNDSFHDEQTVACLANFHSEVFFLSPDGIDTTSITTDYNTENFVKNEMIKNADKVFAIADYTKIGKRCLKKICDIEQIAKIITDDKTPREQLRAFKETGIVIEVAK